MLVTAYEKRRGVPIQSRGPRVLATSVYGRILIGSILAVASTVWLLPTPASAQGTSTANINGVVRDASGAVVPGVSVEATSPALIVERKAVTDQQGQYRLSEVPPGTYILTFAKPGFATLKREGLELRTNFTAEIDIQMTVSQQQQTIEVTAAAQLLDTQSVTQQKSVGRDLLDSVPTAKGALGIASLVPSVVEPPNAQDVGGSKGERSVRITVHGGKTTDARGLQDGMRYNALTPGLTQITNGAAASNAPSSSGVSTVAALGLEGTGRGYYINPLSIQEVVVDLGTMGSAEYSLGGAQVNGIPKDGGNHIRGSLFAAGTDAALQWGNLDDNLRSQGLTSVNSVRAVYDADAAIGGPIKTDRLWFFASIRRWGTKTRVGNLYSDSNVQDFVFTPNLNRPVEPVETDRAYGFRLAGQATAKDKITFSYDRQKNFQDQLTGQLETGTLKNEANAGYCQRQDVTQVTWTRPQSATLLFDGGVTVSRFNFGGFGKDLFLSDYLGCGGGIQDNVSILDVGLGYTYNGVGNRTTSLSHQLNGRASVSIVKGSHNIKVGAFWMYGLGGGQRTYTTRSPTQVGGLPVSYTFLNGNPISLTEYSSPNLTIDQLSPDLGIFVQDQWRIRRNLTVSAGLRLDWLRESVQAVSVGAGLLVPARSYPAIPDVPNWKDLNPRFGIVWDPKGSGKTAIKFGINRYVTSQATGIANIFDQAATSVTSTTRSWNDKTFAAGDPRRGNFIPDCNLTLTTANGECGAMANAAFGTLTTVNTPDPKWIKGWGKRPYDWQTSVSVEQQITANLVVSAGYYRTWYGNFMVVDNLAVTPVDYSPYSVTVPTDPRLALSGQTLTGLYDINPNKFGQVNNLFTRSSGYGKQSEIYNGVDVNFQLRVKKATAGGGWNIGNAVQLGTTAGGSAQAGTNSCYVIDSPQQLFNCDVHVPYQSRFKFNGTYKLPRGFQAAAVVQSNPGANYNANFAFPLAQIQPSLGRALSGGATSVTIPLVKPYSLFGPRISQLDLRATKFINIGERKLQLNADLYNVLNANTPVTIFGTYNANWGHPTQVLDGRLAKLSVQFDF